MSGRIYQPLRDAGRSRGTPRIANRLLKRVRDYCEIRGNGVITKEISMKALDIYGYFYLILDLEDLLEIKGLWKRQHLNLLLVIKLLL